MREYKFRGKRVDNGEWVYGGFYRGIMPETENPFSLDNARIKKIIIQEGIYYHVNLDTVGQYTGLKDKNGVEIYEGDVVTYPDGDGGYEYCDEIINSGVVTWSNISLCYFATNNNTAEFPTTWEYIEEIQVIGNIHDNPELLDG